MPRRLKALKDIKNVKYLYNNSEKMVSYGVFFYANYCNTNLNSQ